MFKFFRALVERFQARFVADAGLDFEATLVARDAERKAVLLRQAARYHDEGLYTVAEQLRQRAEAIVFSRPMSSLLPATEKNGQADTTLPKPTSSNGKHNRLPDLTNTNTRKK